MSRLVYSRRRRNCPMCGRSVTLAWNVATDGPNVWACDDCRPGGTTPNQAADAAKETPIMATATKTCPGVKDGSTVIVTPHEAPATEAVFGKNAARKDGLGRVCKADWTTYTAILKARKTSGAPAAPKAAKEPKAPKAAKGTTTTAPEITDHALVATYGETAGWTTEVIGTTRFAIPSEVATVATDEGQEALAAVAKAKDAARKREARAAAKAQAVATA